jgi:hypothetical protein
MRQHRVKKVQHQVCGGTCLPGRLEPPASVPTWQASDRVGCDSYLHMIAQH